MATKLLGTKDFVDPQTGEIQRFLVIAPQNVDVDYVKVFIPFVREVIEDKDLVSKAFKLLLWIMSNLDWNDLKVVMNSKKVCKDLGITDRTYYRWKKVLVRKGILHPDPESREIYWLRPYAVIRGSMEKIPEQQPLPFELKKPGQPAQAQAKN